MELYDSSATIIPIYYIKGIITHVNFIYRPYKEDFFNLYHDASIIFNDSSAK